MVLASKAQYARRELQRALWHNGYGNLQHLRTSQCARTECHHATVGSRQQVFSVYTNRNRHATGWGYRSRLLQGVEPACVTSRLPLQLLLTRIAYRDRLCGWRRAAIGSCEGEHSRRELQHSHVSRQEPRYLGGGRDCALTSIRQQINLSLVVTRLHF